jgi:hypothetical protein
VSLTSAAVVATLALLAPLAVGLLRIRVPELVLEILARVPVFLAALLVVRGLPALASGGEQSCSQGATCAAARFRTG